LLKGKRSNCHILKLEYYVRIYAFKFVLIVGLEKGIKNTTQVSIGEAYVKSHRELERGEKFSQRT